MVLDVEGFRLLLLHREIEAPCLLTEFDILLDMEFNISDYLKKFSQFLPYETRVKKSVSSAVLVVVGIALERRQMTVAGSKVFILGSSSLKSELALKQGKILARIKELDSTLNIERVG